MAFALAELGGVDKTGQCGQNQRGSKGSVEDKVHKGKRLRVERRADRGEQQMQRLGGSLEDAKGVQYGQCGPSQAGPRRVELSGAGDLEDVQDTGQGFIPQPVDGGQGGTVRASWQRQKEG